jgi:altronate dehydratase small subunit
MLDVTAQAYPRGGVMADDQRLLLLGPDDTVLVARRRIATGELLTIAGVDVVLAFDLALGHKLARVDMKPGDKVIKYGAPIGVATTAIRRGDHVHVHNIRSDYTPTHYLAETSGVTA